MEYVNGFAVIGPDDEFPDAASALSDYPLGFGRVLTGDLMLRGYKKGIFAWSTNPVSWWSPDPRAILEFERFKVSKRLARKINQNRFGISIDLAFEEVVDGCAGPRKHEDGTWISDEFRDCFSELYHRGYAHSLECWQDGALVGGVLGVGVASFFSAESMFHLVSDASKIALFYLLKELQACGITLVDLQVLTPHTARLGAELIRRDQYLTLLKKAISIPARQIVKRVIIEQSSNICQDS